MNVPSPPDSNDTIRTNSSDQQKIPNRDRRSPCPIPTCENEVRARYLQIHLFNKHDLISAEYGLEVDKSLVCEICEGTFTTKKTLRFHMTNQHKLSETTVLRMGTVHCMFCQERFSTLRKLCEHVIAAHPENIHGDTTPVDRIFDGREQFEEWLLEKRRQGTQLMRASKRVTKGTELVRYFRCANSKRKPSKSLGIRHGRTSKKVVVTCTTNLNVVEKEDGTITAQGFVFHVHPLNPKEVKLDLDTIDGSLEFLCGSPPRSRKRKETKKQREEAAPKPVSSDEESDSETEDSAVPEGRHCIVCLKKEPPSDGGDDSKDWMMCSDCANTA